MQLAAEQEIVEAQARVAQLYQEGLGVAQDHAEAAKWFRRAAEQAHLESQYRLGLCFENAAGVPQDYVEAYKWWYNIATALGFKQANESRDRMLGRLSAEQIAASQQQATALYRLLRQKLAAKMPAAEQIRSVLQRQSEASGRS